MKIELKGIQETVDNLYKMRRLTKPMLKEAIYRGTGHVASAMRRAIQELPEEKSVHGGLPRIAREGAKLRGVTKEQKSDLLQSMGIAKMIEGMTGINAKVGFDGYGSTPTSRWWQGIPNALLARGLESGTYFRQKTPFIRPTVTRERKKTEAIMEQVLRDRIGKEWKTK